MFSVEQKNNFLTGVSLTSELPSPDLFTRKFITIHSYTKSRGRTQLPSVILNRPEKDKIWFTVEIFQIPISFYDPTCEIYVEDYDLLNHKKIRDIFGFEALSVTLQNYISDFSTFIPSYKSDSLY